MIFGNYKFTLHLNDDALLPYYKGSTFRGVLGHALKKTVCALRKQACDSCVLRSGCTYAMVFETARAVALPEGARISSAPHPMVLEPPLTQKQQFSKGDSLTCTLKLFGEINRNLPYFVYAFDQMGQLGIGKRINGRRSSFTLASVHQVDGSGNETEVYRHTDKKLNLQDFPGQIGVESMIPATPPKRGHLTLKIVTPLRIIARDAPVARLPFAVLMRSIIRRVTALLNVYGNGEPDLDYSGLIKTAEGITISQNRLKWLDWKRYSSRHDKKMLMGGLIGDVTYEGDFTAFLPLLKMAEAVHVGKNTAFGLGKVIFSNSEP